MGCIYKLTFRSGKSYIGQTVRSLTTRITAHRNAASTGSTLAVHCAWREHGSPSVQVLVDSDDATDLHRMEMQLIADHGTRSPGGYNISEGGDTSPSKSPDVAAKIALKATGRKWSEEKKLQMAQSMRERWKDPEYRARVSASLSSGWTDERRVAVGKRLSAISAGRKLSHETKQKLREKIVSDETRHRMSEAAKRRGPPTKAQAASVRKLKGAKLGPYSEERKMAAAAGVKAAWADPEKRERLVAARKAAWETRRAKEK